MQCNAMQCNAMQCNAMQCNAWNSVYKLSLKEFSPIKVLVKNMNKIYHIEIHT